MRKLLLSFLCLLWILPVSAQLEIKDFDTKDFPKVSFSLKTYNPDVQSMDRISVFEEDTLVSVTNFEPLETPASSVIKNVLFVWDLRGKESFVPELLFDFFNGMTATLQANDSLKVNVAVFRRDEEGKPLYEPLFASFTSDLQRMGNRVIEEAEKELTANIAASDIVWALRQAVDQIKVQPANEAKAIVLYTVGKNNLNSGFETTPLVTQAKENRIQIYVVNIAGGEAGETLSQDLSARTYGQYLLSEGSFDDRDKRDKENETVVRDNKAKNESKPLPYPFFLFSENETVNAWVNDLPKRWAGIIYKVTFESRSVKDGQTKEIKVRLGDESGSKTYNVPKYTFGNWIKDHLVLFIVLLFVAVAGIGTGLFFLIRYLRDVAADKREEEEKKEEERKRLKAEQENLRRKLEVAENEKRKRQEQEKAKEKAAMRQEQLDALNALMRSKNIKARLLVSTMSGAFEYMVGTAENTIGTAEDNDIVINDRTVSRHHAVLYFDGQSFGIRDLRSTNGVVMNGFKVDDLKLRNGDSVSLGNAVMKIYF